MNFVCKYISEEYREQWEFLISQSSAGGFNQSFSWAGFNNVLGWKSYKIGLFDEQSQELFGGAVLFRFTFKDIGDLFYIPDGPILNFGDETQSVNQWNSLFGTIEKIILTSENPIALRVEPRLDYFPAIFKNFSKAPKNLQPQNTQIINLEQDEDRILGSMKQKCRYNIGLAGRKGVRVRKIESVSNDDLEIFYELYKKTFERKSLKYKEKHVFEKFVEKCSDISSLYFAEYEGVAVAAAFVITFGNRATYYYGASDYEYKDLMGSYLMHWEIMKDLKLAGLKEYDLYGISPSRNPDHQWSKISRFKKGFGGFEQNFVGALDLVYDKVNYKKFIETYELIS